MKTLGEFQKFIFFLAVAALLCASSSLVAADADFAFADAAVADAPPPASEQTSPPPPPVEEFFEAPAVDDGGSVSLGGDDSGTDDFGAFALEDSGDFVPAGEPDSDSESDDASSESDFAGDYSGDFNVDVVDEDDEGMSTMEKAALIGTPAAGGLGLLATLAKALKSDKNVAGTSGAGSEGEDHDGSDKNKKSLKRMTKEGLINNIAEEIRSTMTKQDPEGAKLKLRSPSVRKAIRGLAEYQYRKKFGHRYDSYLETAGRVIATPFKAIGKWFTGSDKKDRKAILQASWYGTLGFKDDASKEFLKNNLDRLTAELELQTPDKSKKEKEKLKAKIKGLSAEVKKAEVAGDDAEIKRMLALKGFTAETEKRGQSDISAKDFKMLSEMARQASEIPGGEDLKIKVGEPVDDGYTKGDVDSLANRLKNLGSKLDNIDSLEKLKKQVSGVELTKMDPNELIRLSQLQEKIDWQKQRHQSWLNDAMQDIDQMPAYQKIIEDSQIDMMEMPSEKQMELVRRGREYMAVPRPGAFRPRQVINYADEDKERFIQTQLLRARRATSQFSSASKRIARAETAKRPAYSAARTTAKLKKQRAIRRNRGPLAFFGKAFRRSK